MGPKVFVTLLLVPSLSTYEKPERRGTHCIFMDVAFSLANFTEVGTEAAL
jgi:hypothetical protein